MRNIELKVATNGFKGILTMLRHMRAQFMGTLRQVDTYYESANGRLKLREINGRDCEFIFYERPDNCNSKISDYLRISITTEQLHPIKNVLGKALGEKVIVKKKRKLWMYKNTRIHLDTVKRLGTFLELETAVKKGYPREARIEHKEIVELLGLSQFKKYAGSYGDMLPRKNKERR